MCSSVHADERGERERDGDHEEGTHLHGGSADRHEAVAAEVAERQRVGEDVARPREHGRENGADGERDRDDRRDPADRRAAREVRLHREEIAPGARDDADRHADDEREQEARAVRGRLRHGAGPRDDEQRREDAEADELAEGEVDDPGQAVDEGLARPRRARRRRRPQVP